MPIMPGLGLQGTAPQPARTADKYVILLELIVLDLCLAKLALEFAVAQQQVRDGGSRCATGRYVARIMHAADHAVPFG